MEIKISINSKSFNVWKDLSKKKKVLVLSLVTFFTLSAALTAHVITFNPGDPIRSTDINHNLAFLPPIGSIIAWHRDFKSGYIPNIPDGWKICDGSVISDEHSPFNNMRTPDLNVKGLFLRGNPDSGELQDDMTAAPKNSFETGDESVFHTHGPGTLSGYYKGRNDDNKTNRVWGSLMYYFSSYDTNSSSNSVYLNAGQTANQSNYHSHKVTQGGDPETRPKNMSVIWIMKIK